MKWLGLRLLWLLGYCWSALTVVPGLFLLAAAYAFGWVESTEWRGPALIVRMHGPWADWMQTPNSRGFTFYGHTVGLCVFGYRPLGEQEATHEIRHVWQQMVLGPFHLLIYGISMVAGMAWHRSAFLAYRDCILERDARRVAGEPD